MRRAFWHTIHGLMAEDERLFLLFADVGEYTARHCIADFPGRVYNVGIREQALIGIAAGLAKGGKIPIIYGIAPFVVERCYEQIKVDLGINDQKAIIVSVGASFDYSKEGPTHHCPADVPLLYQIPNIRIYVPGAATEVGDLLKTAIEGEGPAYIRLAETDYPGGHGAFWQAQVGTEATIIAIGPAISVALKAFQAYDVTILYTNAVRPLDVGVLCYNTSRRVMLVEPYNRTLAYEMLCLTRAERFTSISLTGEIVHDAAERGELMDRLGMSVKELRRVYKEELMGE